MLDSPIETKYKDSFDEDKSKILDALRRGRCFVVNYYHGDAKGFRFFAECGGNSYSMGDAVKLNGSPAILKVFTPKTSSIRLIRNGEQIKKAETMEAIWDVKEGGIYRVECWLKDKGWIFSNHIRIDN